MADILSLTVTSPNPRQGGLTAAKLVKITPGQENMARKAMRENGVDDIAIRMNKDLYIASAPRMDLSEVQAGADIEVKGQVGTVVAIDDQLSNEEVDEYNARAGRRQAIAAGVVIGGTILTGGVVGAVVTGGATAVVGGAAVFGFGGLGMYVGPVSHMLGLPISGANDDNMNLLKMYGKEVVD